VFVYQARSAFPGAAGFDHRIAQVEFVPAGRASVGIEPIEQSKIDDIFSRLGSSHGLALAAKIV